MAQSYMNGKDISENMLQVTRLLNHCNLQGRFACDTKANYLMMYWSAEFGTLCSIEGLSNL